MFYLTHLLAGIWTHHCMLNSINGNAIVIKGLVSQLLLAHILCALNRNRWRTSGAPLNTHTQSPKAHWQTVLLFFIYFLSTWGRDMGILCQNVYWSWARSSGAPASLNIEHTWTNTGTAVFHYVKCRCDSEILLRASFQGSKKALKHFWRTSKALLKLLTGPPQIVDNITTYVAFEETHSSHHLHNLWQHYHLYWLLNVAFLIWFSFINLMWAK